MPTSRRALTLSALDFPRFLLDWLPAQAGLPFAHLHQLEVTKVHQVEVTEVHQVEVTEVHQVEVTKVHQVEVIKVHQVEVTKVHQVEVIKVHQVQFTNLHQGGVHLARVEQSISVAWEIENSNTWGFLLMKVTTGC